MELSYNSPWYTMSAPSAQLAERLAGHAPGDLDHVFFTTGGSSAVETALRFMQFFNNVRGRPEKKMIVSRDGAYHGSTYLSGSLNGRPRDRDWMDGADELVIRLGWPDPFRRPAGMSVEAFTDILVEEFRARSRATAPSGSALSSASRSRPRAGSWCRRRAICSGCASSAASTTSCLSPTRW